MPTVSPSGSPTFPTSIRLSVVPDARFTAAQLWPPVQHYARQYGADARLMMGLIFRESGFKNWRVHSDGTGHGLVGLDDNGLLRDFERWSGMRVGRGRNASTIPPDAQLEYLASKLGELQRQYGGHGEALRAWHRGPSSRNDRRGHAYERAVRAAANRLHLPSRPAAPPAQPPPSGGGGPAQSVSSVVVKRGDSLWRIAERLQAQGQPGSVAEWVERLIAANPQLRDPDELRVGERLSVPAGGRRVDGFQPLRHETVVLQPAGPEAFDPAAMPPFDPMALPLGGAEGLVLPDPEGADLVFG